MAMAAGYGKVMWMEPVHDRTGLAGYLQKLSDCLIGDEARDMSRYNAAKEMVGGSKKGIAINQIPDQEAPPHFRRLRPSRGLLPPVKKNQEITGEMIQDMLEVVEARLEAEGKLANARIKPSEIPAIPMVAK